MAAELTPEEIEEMREKLDRLYKHLGTFVEKDVMDIVDVIVDLEIRLENLSER